MLLYFTCSSAIFPMFAAVQLTIEQQATNGVIVTWPSTGFYTLQTNNSLTTTNWAAYNGTVANNNGTNTVTIGSAIGRQFFRLSNAGTISLTSPTNIGNGAMAYYWNYRDLAVGANITSWADQVSHLSMKTEGAASGSSYDYPVVLPFSLLTEEPTPFDSAFPGLGIPTVNSYSGAAQISSLSLTNNLTFGSNFTFWIVIRPTFPAIDLTGTPLNTNWSIFGDNNGHGFIIATNVFAANWGTTSTNYSSLSMEYSNSWSYAYGKTYDIVDSGGTVYSNGVPMRTGVGQPTNNFPFRAIGAYSNGISSMGFIQYIGIWTNYVLTAADVSNLDYWVNSYGVTNITNGLIAWWRLNDGSGTTAADSSGSGNTLSFDGTGQVWTNNGPTGGGLYFNGSGGATNSNHTLADNLSNMTVSCWVAGTNLVQAAGASFFSKGAVDGWGLFSDGGFGGPDDVSFGSYDVNGSNWRETAHFWGPVPYPAIGDGRWHFVVGVLTNFVPEIYIDGAEFISIPGNNGTGGGGAVTNISSSLYPIMLGEGYQNGILYPIQSTFDDVRIYNRALSPQEIYDLYRWRGQP